MPADAEALQSKPYEGFRRPAYTLAGSTSQTGRSRNDDRSLLHAGKAGSRSYKQLSLQYWIDNKPSFKAI